MQGNEKLRILVEAAVMVALAFVLSLIKIPIGPQGGSVTAGSMVPILYLGLRYGWRTGILAGVALGLINYISEPFAVHWAQVLLDYPVAFGLLGLAGLTKNPLLGATLGIGGRFLSHFIAGVVFFADYAPEGVSPWVYSAGYNASYLAPELVVSVVILYFLYPTLQKISRRQAGAA